MLNRRNFLADSAMRAGFLSIAPSLHQVLAAPTITSAPRRFIFIRKSSGIRPKEIAPLNLSDQHRRLDEMREPFETALDGHELPLWLRGLEPYRERMTILQGLSAKMSENIHWSFSSVMGCFKSNRNTLSAIKRTTIDFELAKLFPSPFG
ncbi:MAG: hypothetical protein ACPGXX_09355, partial [Planctomycetaceae bacterium]